MITVLCNAAAGADCSVCAEGRRQQVEWQRAVHAYRLTIAVIPWSELPERGHLAVGFLIEASCGLCYVLDRVILAL